MSKESISPRGVAVYPRLNTPDTKFDENGIYKCHIAVEADAADSLLKDLKKVWKEHTKKPVNPADNPMFKMELDDEGEETGRVIFKFQVKNRINKKGELWDRQPIVFDAKGRRVDPVPNIGGGSVLRVFFETYCWDAGGKLGVSLQPKSVQLIELHEYSGAEENPFDEVEGGFETEESDEDNPFTNEEPEDDDF